MNTKERFAYLKLALSQNVGPITFKELIKHFKSADKAIENILDFKFKSSKRVIKLAPDSFVYEQFETAQKIGAQILFLEDEEYPALLKYIEDAPPVLFVYGNKKLLNQKSISIVGSRNASLNGISLAKKTAYDLASQNISVISGLAKGIDRAAHEGALAAQNSSGSTVAVLGTGVDVLYPRENKDIYDKIKGMRARPPRSALTIKTRRNKQWNSISNRNLTVALALKLSV